MKANDRLAKIVAGGKTRYIVLYGVFGWGLFTATLVAAFKFFFKEKLGIADVVITFIVFPIAGIFWGAIMWSSAKRRYDASIEKSI